MNIRHYNLGLIIIPADYDTVRQWKSSGSEEKNIEYCTFAAMGWEYGNIRYGLAAHLSGDLQEILI